MKLTQIALPLFFAVNMAHAGAAEPKSVENNETISDKLYLQYHDDEWAVQWRELNNLPPESVQTAYDKMKEDYLREMMTVTRGFKVGGEIRYSDTAGYQRIIAKRLDTDKEPPQWVCPTARVLVSSSREIAKILVEMGDISSAELAQENQKRGEFHVRKHGCKGPEAGPR